LKGTLACRSCWSEGIDETIVNPHRWLVFPALFAAASFESHVPWLAIDFFQSIGSIEKKELARGRIK
jgi:hypothetical protein